MCRHINKIFPPAKQNEKNERFNGTTRRMALIPYCLIVLLAITSTSTLAKNTREKQTFARTHDKPSFHAGIGFEPLRKIRFEDRKLLILSIIHTSEVRQQIHDLYKLYKQVNADCSTTRIHKSYVYLTNLTMNYMDAQGFCENRGYFLPEPLSDLDIQTLATFLRRNQVQHCHLGTEFYYPAYMHHFPNKKAWVYNKWKGMTLYTADGNLAKHQLDSLLDDASARFYLNVNGKLAVTNKQCDSSSCYTTHHYYYQKITVAEDRWSTRSGVVCERPILEKFSCFDLVEHITHLHDDAARRYNSLVMPYSYDDPIKYIFNQRTSTKRVPIRVNTPIAPPLPSATREKRGMFLPVAIGGMKLLAEIIPFIGSYLAHHFSLPTPKENSQQSSAKLLALLVRFSEKIFPTIIETHFQINWNERDLGRQAIRNAIDVHQNLDQIASIIHPALNGLTPFQLLPLAELDTYLRDLLQPLGLSAELNPQFVESLLIPATQGKFAILTKITTTRAEHYDLFRIITLPLFLKQGPVLPQLPHPFLAISTDNTKMIPIDSLRDCRPNFCPKPPLVYEDDAPNCLAKAYFRISDINECPLIPFPSAPPSIVNTELGHVFISLPINMVEQVTANCDHYAPNSDQRFTVTGLSILKIPVTCNANFRHAQMTVFGPPAIVNIETRLPLRNNVSLDAVAFSAAAHNYSTVTVEILTQAKRNHIRLGKFSILIAIVATLLALLTLVFLAATGRAFKYIHLVKRRLKGRMESGFRSETANLRDLIRNTGFQINRASSSAETAAAAAVSANSDAADYKVRLKVLADRVNQLRHPRPQHYCSAPQLDDSDDSESASTARLSQAPPHYATSSRRRPSSNNTPYLTAYTPTSQSPPPLAPKPIQAPKPLLPGSLTTSPLNRQGTYRLDSTEARSRQPLQTTTIGQYQTPRNSTPIRMSILTPYPGSLSNPFLARPQGNLTGALSRIVPGLGSIRLPTLIATPPSSNPATLGSTLSPVSMPTLYPNTSSSSYDSNNLDQSTQEFPTSPAPTKRDK
jgi:hypothetical protein